MEPRTNPTWKFQFSLPFRVEGPDIVVDFLPTAKTIRVLELLVAANGSWLERDGIAYELWPGHNLSKSRANLRQALATIRKAFRPHDIIEAEATLLRVNLDSVEHDGRAIKNLVVGSSPGGPRQDQLEDDISRELTRDTPAHHLDLLIRSIIQAHPDRALDLLAAAPDIALTLPTASLRSHAQFTARLVSTTHAAYGWAKYFVAYSDLLVGRYQDGVGHLQEARQHAIQTADRNLYIQSLMFLSFAYTELGLAKMAVNLADEGLQQVSVTRRSAEYAKLTHAKGAAYVHAGRASRGVPLMLEAASILRSEGKEIERAHCFSNLYVFARESNFTEVAEFARQEATQWAACSSDWRSAAACTYGDMIGYVRRGEYDLAQNHARALQATAIEWGCIPFNAYASEGFAQVSLMRGEFQAAAAQLAEALTNRRIQGFRASVAERAKLRNLANEILAHIPSGAAPILSAL